MKARDLDDFFLERGEKIEKKGRKKIVSLMKKKKKSGKKRRSPGTLAPVPEPFSLSLDWENVREIPSSEREEAKAEWKVGKRGRQSAHHQDEEKKSSGKRMRSVDGRRIRTPKKKNTNSKTGGGLTAKVHCTSLARAASSETSEARGMVASASNSPERSSAALTGANGEAIVFEDFGDFFRRESDRSKRRERGLRSFGGVAPGV